MLKGMMGNWLLGHPKPTIDIISIGMVADDGREYYAISKDFNLKEAWNRYDIKTMTNLRGDSDTNQMKVYWIRENVLKPIYYELCLKDEKPLNSKNNPLNFSYKTLKNLINKVGKTNKQIAEEVKEFVYQPYGHPSSKYYIFHEQKLREEPIDIYGYYSDYDWVAFCWLFGKMMDLPKGFPMYCKDLKQIIDDKFNTNKYPEFKIDGLDSWLKDLKKHPDYPKQTNEHNALADAKWNYELYKFLKSI